MTIGVLAACVEACDNTTTLLRTSLVMVSAEISVLLFLKIRLTAKEAFKPSGNREFQL
jgi:hypothetical protein